jgi:hypothetical protein
MRSQTRWGMFFISTGLLLGVIGLKLAFILLYSGILIAIGTGLIIFRKREEIIEGEYQGECK